MASVNGSKNNHNKVDFNNDKKELDFMYSELKPQIHDVPLEAHQDLSPAEKAILENLDALTEAETIDQIKMSSITEHVKKEVFKMIDFSKGGASKYLDDYPKIFQAKGNWRDRDKRQNIRSHNQTFLIVDNKRNLRKDVVDIIKKYIPVATLIVGIILVVYRINFVGGFASLDPTLILGVAILSFGLAFLFNYLRESTTHALITNTVESVVQELDVDGIRQLVLEQGQGASPQSINNLIDSTVQRLDIDGLRSLVVEQNRQIPTDLINSTVNSVLQSLNVNGLRDEVSLQRDFNSLGIKQFHKTRPNPDEYLKDAEPGSEIKILGTGLMRFNSYESQSLLHNKLQDGCNIKLLALDPDSEFVKQRGIEETRKYEEIQGHIHNTNLNINLFIENTLPEFYKERIKFRTYDTLPTIFFLSNGSVAIVGFYLRAKRGEAVPHIELDIKEGGISKAFMEHFDALWEASREPAYINVESTQ